MPTGMDTSSPCVRVTGRSISVKKSWKTFRLEVAASERALLRGCKHRHAPCRDVVGDGNRDAGAAVGAVMISGAT